MIRVMPLLEHNCDRMISAFRVLLATNPELKDVKGGDWNGGFLTSKNEKRVILAAQDFAFSNLLTYPTTLMVRKYSRSLKTVYCLYLKMLLYSGSTAR